MSEKETDKIHLVFDTNILRAEPFYKKAEYDALSLLVEHEHINVYIPTVVHQEYIEQLKDEFVNKIDSLKNHYSNLERSHYSSSDILKKIEPLIIELHESGLKKIEQEFSAFFYDKLSATELKIKPQHTNNMFEDYFSGNGVFSRKKHRDDIPDAFVFESIKDLKKQYDNVIVLVADKRFADACQKIDIPTYDKIKNFLSYNPIQEILKSRSQKRFIQFITKEYDLTYIVDSHIDLIDHLSDKTITSYDIPSDSHDALITSIGESSDLKLDSLKFTHYGTNKISIPFSCNVDVNIMFEIFKSDYYVNDYQFDIFEDLNDHYFLISENVLVQTKGDLIIDFSMIDFSEIDIDLEYAAESIEAKVNSINKIKLVSFSTLSPPEDLIECECANCKEITVFDCNYIDWSHTGSRERNMGIENCYTASLNFICDCKNEITVEFNTYEYPKGVINMTDHSAIGCTIDKECVYPLLKSKLC